MTEGQWVQNINQDARWSQSRIRDQKGGDDRR